MCLHQTRDGIANNSLSTMDDNRTIAYFTISSTNYNFQLHSHNSIVSHRRKEPMHRGQIGYASSSCGDTLHQLIFWISCTLHRFSETQTVYCNAPCCTFTAKMITFAPFIRKYILSPVCTTFDCCFRFFDFLAHHLSKNLQL